MKTVSIIIPVFNSEKYLADCIQSVISQQYTNIEIILVDDGSTDSSFEICERYRDTDSRIKLYRKENGGQGSARNLGLQKASGEYILFVDSDDTLASDTISANIRFLTENTAVDFVQFPTYMYYGGKAAYIRKNAACKYTSVDDFISLALEKDTISWLVWDKIFRRSLIQGMSFREDIKYEDNYFIMELLPGLSEVYISDKGLYYYHHRENSTTTSGLSQLKEKSTVEVLDLQLQLLQKPLYSKVFVEFLLRLVNVEKSLKINFGFLSNRSSRYRDCLSLRQIFSSNLSLKEILKLISFRTLS